MNSHLTAPSLAWVCLTIGILAANLVEQELIQKLELIGIGDLAEH